MSFTLVLNPSVNSEVHQTERTLSMLRSQVLVGIGVMYM